MSWFKSAAGLGGSGGGSSAESLVPPPSPPEDRQSRGGAADLDFEVAQTTTKMTLLNEASEHKTTAKRPEVRPMSAAVPLPANETLAPVSGGSRQTLAAAVACLLPLIFGQYVGWISAVQPLLESDESPVGPLSSDQVSWLASLVFIGGIVGTFFWGRLADCLGRKWAILLAGVPAGFGWGLAAFTHDPNALLVGRFCGGFAGSGGLILAPLYIGEIAQDRLRGALGSFTVLAVNSGILISYLLGSALPYKMFNYACFSTPIIFIFLFIWMPETPNYLWNKNRKSQAEKSILWLRANNQQCLQDETFEFSCRKKQEDPSYKSLFDSQGKRRGMIIGLGLFTWQQFCGILAILSYASFIFYKSEITSISPERATIIVGMIQLFSSFVSSAIVERSGRKLLLLISYFFMAFSLIVIGLYFYLEKIGWDVSSFSWVPVASLSLHVLTYALGAGPVPYVIMSETLPSEIRGLANSVIIFWGTLLAFASVKIFPLLIQYTQLYGCFWFYAIFSCVGFLFTWRVVPETKGVPINVILDRLNGKKYNSGYNAV